MFLLLRLAVVFLTRLRAWMIGEALKRAKTAETVTALELAAADQKPDGKRGGTGTVVAMSPRDVYLSGQRYGQAYQRHERAAKRTLKREARAERIKARRERLARPGWVACGLAGLDGLLGASVLEVGTGVPLTGWLARAWESVGVTWPVVDVW